MTLFRSQFSFWIANIHLHKICSLSGVGAFTDFVPTSIPRQRDSCTARASTIWLLFILSMQKDSRNCPWCCLWPVSSPCARLLLCWWINNDIQTGEKKTNHKKQALNKPCPAMPSSKGLHIAILFQHWTRLHCVDASLLLTSWPHYFWRHTHHNHCARETRAKPDGTQSSEQGKNLKHTTGKRQGKTFRVQEGNRSVSPALSQQGQKLRCEITQTRVPTLCLRWWKKEYLLPSWLLFSFFGSCFSTCSVHVATAINKKSILISVLSVSSRYFREVLWLYLIVHWLKTEHTATFLYIFYTYHTSSLIAIVRLCLVGIQSLSLNCCKCERQNNSTIHL